MKILVVRDSAYGNTAKVADAMAIALMPSSAVHSISIRNLRPSKLANVDLLIVGSPTQAGKATKLTDEFLKELAPEIITSARFAVFDTRFDPRMQKKSLQLLMKITGFAAPKMAAIIKRRGGKLIAEPQGFIVNDMEGPLKDGELERAAEWAKTVYAAIEEPSRA